MLDSLAKDPILSDVSQVCMIDLVDDARIPLPLCNILHVDITLPASTPMDRGRGPLCSMPSAEKSQSTSGDVDVAQTVCHIATKLSRKSICRSTSRTRCSGSTERVLHVVEDLRPFFLCIRQKIPRDETKAQAPASSCMDLKVEELRGI